MAKVTAPFLAISASGSVAKTIVAGSWRGVQYVRQHVTPANPKTTAQTEVRNTFSGLDDQFKRMLTLAQEPFTAAAKGKPLTARNAFIKANLPEVRGEADMAKYVASPGVAGGLPGTNFSVSTGAAAGELDISVDITDGPLDWAQPSVIFTAFPDRDPTVLMTDFVEEASESGAGSPPSYPATVTHTFSGLTAGADYVGTACVVWTRADGVTAYGPGQTAIAAAGS